MRIPVNGIHISVDEQGKGSPVLFIHGFTGSAQNWSAVFDKLPLRGFRKIAVDVIGHGKSDSPEDPERYLMERCVEDLTAILDHLSLDRVAVVGYSMGARIALQFAAAAPARVTRLVLESGSPGLATEAERTARIAGDEALAQYALDQGITAFVDRWQSLPMWASQTALPQESRARLRAQRLTNSPLGLANSLRGMGTGRQSSLWDRLPTLKTPTLLLAGQHDPKYVEIAHQMAALLPSATLEVVPNAGHTINLEQPVVYSARVSAFLRSRVREAATQ